ncbi:MAG: hypothetical protein QM270_11020 [Bacillota bacterium]|nr:hypothetical protein [Bacillota bacterium]
MAVTMNAFAEKGRWYRGATHAHTNRSDGCMTPAELVAAYRGEGYDFLSITDHRIYGVHADLASEDFLLIPGVELDIPGDHVKAWCHHVVGLACPDAEGWACGERVEYPASTDVNQLIRLLADRGHYTIYAHPLWSHVLPEAMDEIHGFDAVEISNYGCSVAGLVGRADMHIQRLQWLGRRFHSVASDDSHQHYPDHGGAWIMVQAEELSQAAIMKSMREGRYYASEGPEIRSFRIEDDVVLVETSNCRVIALYSDGFHCSGMPSLTGTARIHRYRLTGKESYVQAVCEDTSGRRAWSQPLWLR